MLMRCFVCVLLWLGSAFSAWAQEAVVTGHVDLIGPGGKTWRGQREANTAVWLTRVAGAPSSVTPGTDGMNPSLTKPSPKLEARLVQKNKSFEPRVLLIPAGTAVEFPNRDPFFHNVFSLFEGKRFDLGLYEAGGTRFVQFDRPGISYIFCNIHPEMNAVVIAVATPYYGLSDHAGNLTIRGVPPGRYMVHLWNERALPEVAESATRELTVTQEGASFGTIRLPVTAGPPAPHKNKYGRDYDPSAPANPIYEQP
jgi:plastocyanin